MLASAVFASSTFSNDPSRFSDCIVFSLSRIVVLGPHGGRWQPPARVFLPTLRPLSAILFMFWSLRSLGRGAGWIACDSRVPRSGVQTCNGHIYIYVSSLSSAAWFRMRVPACVSPVSPSLTRGERSVREPSVPDGDRARSARSATD